MTARDNEEEKPHRHDNEWCFFRSINVTCDDDSRTTTKKKCHIVNLHLCLLLVFPFLSLSLSLLSVVTLPTWDPNGRYKSNTITYYFFFYLFQCVILMSGFSNTLRTATNASMGKSLGLSVKRNSRLFTFICCLNVRSSPEREREIASETIEMKRWSPLNENIRPSTRSGKAWKLHSDINERSERNEAPEDMPHARRILWINGNSRFAGEFHESDAYSKIRKWAEELWHNDVERKIMDSCFLPFRGVEGK